MILEKTAFTEDSVENMISGESTFKVNIQNDIYNTLDLYPSALLNGIKTTLIYPATEKHIAKYTAQDMHLITETAQDYESITLPYLNREQFNIQWVFNILEKKTESERIVFEDSNPETGFILLPDMKWNTKQMEDLYLIAIIHKHGIKSLRDLTPEHLPLLRNILNKGLSAILDKYHVPASKLRVYLHYQPSYYHLHVHFTHLRFNAPGSGVDRAHLLSDVIDNIELMPDYYQRKTLSFSSKENEKLSVAFSEAGRI
ncbi:hypothetical protein CAPTEDRAFT_162417 [Capitella teleta]|uniref:m7GpppX diphosphatase n=1 Tax=Capitella teleta TaxID=283909 RepID=R7TSC0_CAPTE|nr:hypothetical protein CAPTEDRAFT_162417 [Capitella teleta]|eukprot:ELT96554.1 hypothetical protein CAPTEDRAFT_162417 [Capitella teleta]